MNFINGEELLKLCHELDCSISEVMMKREEYLFGCTQVEMMERMTCTYDIMKQAAERALRENLVSIEGYNRSASKYIFLNASRNSVCGEMMSKAISYALGVLEVKGSMGQIVEAPSIESSGIIPGVFLAMQERFEFKDVRMVRALFNAGAIGYLIQHYGIALGIEGNADREEAVASAMAASAICELMNGSPKMSLDAAALAMTNMLRRRGNLAEALEEIPYQNNNIMGVSNALLSAEMILCGLGHTQSFDEVLEKMYRIESELCREV